MDDLTIKRCVPCDPEVLRPMLEETANLLLKKVPGWNLVKEDGKLKLQWSFKTMTFARALELFKIVGALAEYEGHHPDLHLVAWNNVKIEICTHAVGKSKDLRKCGLTENDFILAAKINELELKSFLRNL